MPTSTLKDWKYIVMLVVTLAGVFSPVWITRLQSPDKQINIRQISQSAIQSVTKDAVPDLRLMVDGVLLSDPYLSVLEISNDGDKPILIRDFEAPLEIQLGKDRNVIRAKISEKSPADVIGDVSWEKNAVWLAPTLLNPRDRMTVTILSIGGEPELLAKARIAGVGSVPVIKAEKPKPKLSLSIMLLVGAFLFAVPSLAALWRLPVIPSKGVLVKFRPRTVFTISVMLQFAVVGSVSILLAINGIESTWIMILVLLGIFGLALPFAKSLESHPNDDRPAEPKQA